ncbi:MAG: hypothetical protein ACYC39_12485 [Thiobacillus sp.]|jgi:hypothetical protein|nr:hypothetical protein [Gammaproteobacteria bacterium]HQT33827.1 hypothetical protein [Thiobacillus sp.]
MRLKTHKLVGLFAWSLAILAASLPVDSVASVQRVATAEMGVDRPPSVRTIAYGAPVYSAYSRPAVNDASSRGASRVSVAPEVDPWTMLVAILGLISMRLWRSGKKKLLVIQ